MAMSLPVIISKPSQAMTSGTTTTEISATARKASAPSVKAKETRFSLTKPRFSFSS
jgi:hypothetical protein